LVLGKSRIFYLSNKMNNTFKYIKFKYIISMDVNKLMKALDDENNENLMNFTSKKIKEMNLKVLKELHLSRDETIELFKKLIGYRYVDEIQDLKYGTYLRWIPLTNPNLIKLSRGAIFCELKIEQTGLSLVCKNYGFNCKHFQIKLDECLVFQKLTDQEKVLLSALDHLSK